MLKTLLYLSIVCLLISCAPKTVPTVVTQANPSPPDPPVPPTLSSIPSDPLVRIGTLSNGMTYYLRANSKPENRAELRLAVKAGSMQEDPDQLGLAHFVEHMAFNGSRNFSKNELVNYLESVGSRFGPDLNAYTSFDETVYMLQVRTDEREHFDKGLLILRDWAEGISFDSVEIDKERGVVISEWRSGLSSQERMQKKYLPLIYYQSRYAERLPIGDPEIVRKASYDVVRRFYKDWYRPDLMSVFVVGEINLDSIEMKIKEQFGTIPPSSAVREKISSSFPKHDETFARVITDAEATNSRVEIMYKHTYTPTKNIMDYRNNLVHTLYNRMLGKRLGEIGRQANPPFLFGNTSYRQDVADLGIYSSMAMSEPKNVEKAYRSLLEENRRVYLHGFTESELAREKAAILKQAEQAALEQDKQESGRIIQRLVYHFLEETPIPDATQTLEMYKSMIPTISVSEINQLAKRWITDRNRVILVTGPDKDHAILPDSSTLIRIMNEIDQSTPSPYSDIDLSAPLVKGKFPVQPIISATHDTILDIYHWTFANGVEVSAKPTDFKNDEILMNAYSPGGHSLYPQDKYHSARVTSSVVGNSGVGNYDATGLEKKLTGIRASARPFIFENYEGFNGSSSVADLETMLQLVYAYATSYREDTVALNAMITRERGMFSNYLASPSNWLSNRLTTISTQNHPRRRLPSPESYDEISIKEIMEIYKDRFSDLSDMHFFFVGNFDIDSLQRITSRYLGALPGGNRTETFKDIGLRMPEGRIDSVYNRGEAPKSLVEFIYHGKDQFHPDSAYILQSLIDLARIKLREELREEEGGVYGVNIYGGQVKNPTEQYSINISFNADPTRATELINSARKVIDQMKSTIVYSDIHKVTEVQRQSRIKDLKLNQFWMSAFITNWINGTSMDQAVLLYNLEERIVRLNVDIMQRAARKYFNEGDLISVTMHPAKS